MKSCLVVKSCNINYKVVAVAMRLVIVKMVALVVDMGGGRGKCGGNGGLVDGDFSYGRG